MAAAGRTAWMWVSAVLAIALVAVGGVALGWWGATAGPDPEPTAQSQEPTPTQSAGFLPRPLTEGEGLPSAVPLTEDALDGVGSGWVLGLYDSSHEAPDFALTEGQKVLYLVSPDGQAHEVANLTALDSPVLLAWDPDRGVALVQEAWATVHTLDFASGAIEHSWVACEEGGYSQGLAQADGSWLLRGYCADGSVDGHYADDGTLLGIDGLVLGGEGITVLDVGATQVRFEFEVEPEAKFRAVDGAGETTPLQVPAEVPDCYPGWAPPGSPTLPIQCWEGEDVSLWLLDLAGGQPTPVYSLETAADVEALTGGLVPAEEGVPFGYCHPGVPLVVTSHPAVVAITHDGPVVVEDSEYMATQCWGAVGDVALVSSASGLWTWDFSTGEQVAMLPTPPREDGDRYLGVGIGGAFIAP